MFEKEENLSKILDFAFECNRRNFLMTTQWKPTPTVEDAIKELEPEINLNGKDKYLKVSLDLTIKQLETMFALVNMRFNELVKPIETMNLNFSEETYRDALFAIMSLEKEVPWL